MYSRVYIGEETTILHFSMSDPSRLARSSLSDGSKSRLRGLSTLLDDRKAPITAPETPPSHLSSPTARTPPPPAAAAAADAAQHRHSSLSSPASRRRAPSPALTPTLPPRSLPSYDTEEERHHGHKTTTSSAVTARERERQRHRAEQADESPLPARAPPVVSGHVNAQLRPVSAPIARRNVERRLAEQHDAKEGGDTRAALLEAGAHLWLAEELRAAADLLSEGAADPRVACERLAALSEALQGEAGRQRWEVGGGTYGGPVQLASKAASCMHRASQCRHAARAIEEYATALRHGGARGWVTVFGHGGVHAANPTLVPTLHSLADAETALARTCARPQSRPGSKDHAHAPLSPSSPRLSSGPSNSGRGISARGGSSHGVEAAPASGHVATRASQHCRQRLDTARDTLMRDASLVCDKSTLLTPAPPDHTTVAARVLAGGGTASGLTSGIGWRGAGDKAARKVVHAELWGSTIHPQHGGTWLGAGWRWRPIDAESESEDDMEAEDEARQVERARKARQAVKTANRLYHSWEPEAGVCVRCVERASRLQTDDRELKGLHSTSPRGAMERWTGEEECFHQQRPTFLAR